MSDNEAQGPVVVWGIPVPRKANGRHMWPDELKSEAARRVLAGETVAAIARDIQANESLVGKWLRDQKNATNSPGDTPHFVQVVTAPPERPSGRQSTSCAASCDLHLGDVRITVTPDYPMARLADLLRAVRASL